MSLTKSMALSDAESTHATEHSDVETLESLESCPSRPLSPGIRIEKEVTGSSIIVKGSFLDCDDQCLMRQYRKLRRAMSDSVLLGVLDVPEVYEPGRFSNDFDQAQETMSCEEKSVATPPTKVNNGKAKKTSGQNSGCVERTTRTTVMLRNLPNNYTRDMFLCLLDEEGLSELYDFVYLPMDFNRDANLGYAFVNFVNHAAVDQAWRVFDGFDRWSLPTAKVCQVRWSGPHQGLHSHVERYRNSPVMHKSVPDSYKPVIFSRGVRQVFPRPTRKVKAPVAPYR